MLDVDKGELVERRSKRGKTFFSCNRYPECDYAAWDRPVAGHPCMHGITVEQVWAQVVAATDPAGGR